MDTDTVYKELTQEIMNCLNVPKQNYGFIYSRIRWAYGIGFDRGRKRGYKEVRVVQLTMDGDFIREWESATIAGRRLNISSSRISAVCTAYEKYRLFDKKMRYKQVGGYRWKYASAFHETGCAALDTRIEESRG